MVKQGYKMTELGEVPVEWDVKSINGVSELVTNGFVGTASPFYTDNGISYLMSNNIRINKIDERNMVSVTKEFTQKYPKCQIITEDMLTVQSGHIGTSCVVPPKYNGVYCHALIITRFNKNKIFPRFIAQYLNSAQGMARLSNVFVGTTVKHINVKDFTKFEIPIPPLAEQQKIADILSTVDEKIDETDQLIIKTQELKKGLIQTLLTKGIGHTEFKETEVGYIPAEWEVKRLIDITELITKGSTPTTYGFSFERTGVNFIRVENVAGGGQILIDGLLKVSEECHRAFARSQLQENDILISIAGSLGRVSLITKELLPANTNQALAIIRLQTEACDCKYLKYWLESAYISKCIKDISTIGAQPNLSLKQINNFNVLIPSWQEQQKIADILSSIDEQITNYEAEKQSLQRLKQGLMQQLLTGKIRVTV